MFVQQNTKHKNMKKTYDIYFTDDTSSNNMGFTISLQSAKDFISVHNGSYYSYFADYKGGTVSIVCNETDEVVHSEDVK